MAGQPVYPGVLSILPDHIEKIMEFFQRFVSRIPKHCTRLGFGMDTVLGKFFCETKKRIINLTDTP